ncbi:hypothetical protein C0993_011886, partial [Termitomyces sp. T159_Od127]
MDLFNRWRSAGGRTMARLPQELVDQIIDHLHDDYPALTSCSLVSHAWRPSSLFHIFSRLSIKVTPSASPADLCRRLYHLLTSSPAICAYIRELDVLEGSQLGTQVAPHAVLAGSSQSVVWVTTDRTLPHIFRRLTHLRRLDFAAQSATIHWSRMPPSARRAVRHMLALPSLTHLRLAFWHFASPADLAALLAHCTHLHALTLANISFGPVPDRPATPPPPVLSDLEEEEHAAPGRRPRSRLRFLSVEHVNSTTFGDWLLGPDSALDLSALRELRVALFNDAAFVRRLVARAGPALQHFHFKMGESHPLPFDLHPNPSLSTLKLTLEDAAHALPWVPALLARLPRANALTHVRLELYTPLAALASSSHAAAWTALDAFFARDAFASLRRVDIGLFALPTSA